MRCEDVDAHFADFLAGTLDAATATEITQHLETCPACAAEAEGLRETWQLLGRVPAERPDSAMLRQRVEAALAGYQSGIDRGGSSTTLSGLAAMWHQTRAGFARFGSYGVQGALAAAVLVIGILVGRQTAPAPPPDPAIEALRTELHDMRQMVTLSLLQQQSASERLRGVTWTSRIEQPDNDVIAALLDALTHDPNVNVRLASIDALKRFAARDVVQQGAIDALSRQTSPLVQMALIDFVAEVNRRDSASALRRLVQDAMVNETVRARAELALRRVG